MRKDSKFIKYLETHAWAAYSFAICCGVLFYFILTHIPSVFRLASKIISLFSPMIVGVVIAYILNPMMKTIESLLKRINDKYNWRWLAIVLTIFIVFVLMFLLMLVLIPSLMESFGTLFANINRYLNSPDNIINKIELMAMRYGVDLSEFGDALSNMIRDMFSSMPTYIAKIISTSYQFGTGMVNGIIGFILAIYFLLGKENMIKFLNSMRRFVFSSEGFEERTRFLHRCNDILTRYIWCTLLEATGVGLVNAILMMILGIPYVALISVVVGLTNMLPTFGPIIGAVIGGFMLLATDPFKALLFVIITFVLQTIDGYIIKPRLFGNTLGVPAIIILIAIVIGGKLFGVIGILLAIPFAAIVTLIYKDAITPYLTRQTQNKRTIA